MSRTRHDCIFYAYLFPYKALRYLDPLSDSPENQRYFLELATKLKDIGYFPEKNSRIMELHFSRWVPTLNSTRECLKHLAAFVDHRPEISGVFGVTYLAPIAERYGFEIIDEPPPTLKFYVAEAFYDSPEFDENILLRMKHGSQPNRVINKVNSLFDGVRTVAIQRDELLRRYYNPDFQIPVVLRE